MDLTLSTREVDGTTIMAVGGEIDVYTAPKLRDKITELVADGVYTIVIDMEAVEFLDSTGLGVLVGGLKKVRAHDGSLELICTQDRLLKIFRITGLAKVFVIHDSADGALAARCDVSKQAISQQIQRLEAQGYVTTCPDPGDQRGRLVALTDRGRAAQDAVHDTFRRVEAAWAERLGAARYDDLRAALATLTGMPHDG